ncbi:hypothetical protein AB0N28_01905 [Streptomyces sp. NPDC051130]|uniref:hypothetical protein n=1 Tax=Streptomyces sp. NPDC051130 TaxID=3157223 RepID=UPI0034439B70
MSRRNVLRSAAAVVPAALIGSALPSTASAAIAAAPRWEVYPVASWPGSSFTFERLDFAPGGAVMALGTDGYFPDGPFGPYQQDPLVWSRQGAQWPADAHRFADGTRPLGGLSVAGDNDAWAVGNRWDGSARRDVPTLLHWDGAAWTDRTAGTADLYDPTQVSGAGSQVWLVGSRLNSTLPSVLRWDGSGWRSVGLPSALGAVTKLRAVEVAAANDVWVAGSTAAGATAPRSSLVMHWNGTAWTALPAPFGPAVGQVSTLLVRGSECWAAGIAADRAAVAHWNGRAWSVSAPATTYYSEVTQLAAYGAEVWATGTNTPLQRWNGTAWSSVTGPKTAPLTSAALATAPDGAIWLAACDKDASGKTSSFFARLPADS